MDIWNVAFPDGAVIDPHTAWKVLWRTAASMYGEGGFRVENIDDRAPEKVSYGISWQSLFLSNATFTIDDKLISSRSDWLTWRYSGGREFPVYRAPWQTNGESVTLAAIAQSRLKYISGFNEFCIRHYANSLPFRCHEKSIVQIYVDSGYRFTNPSLSMGINWSSFFKNGYGESKQDDYFRELLLENEMNMFTDQWYDVRRPLPKQSDDDRYEIQDIFQTRQGSILSFIPAALPLDSTVMDIDWPEWWLDIYDGDTEAYQLGCLLWCDWILDLVRQLISLDESLHHPDFLRFNYSKSSVISGDELSGETSERANALQYQLFLTLPVRPLDY